MKEKKNLFFNRFMIRKVMMMMFLIPGILAGSTGVSADMGSESEATFYVM